MLENTGQTTN